MQEPQAGARALYEELIIKVSGAEAEVENAAMMIGGLKEIEQPLSVSRSPLLQTIPMIDAKLRGPRRAPCLIKDDPISIQIWA